MSVARSPTKVTLTFLGGLYVLWYRGQILGEFGKSIRDDSRWLWLYLIVYQRGIDPSIHVVG